ncbi:MAG: malto-oligosyltrehalose trehalohydrolase [Actinomycetota bacterium]|nr:malto-oligosyltrehalose trehalohydrolase [Actinomycetota bacterium]
MSGTGPALPGAVAAPGGSAPQRRSGSGDPLDATWSACLPGPEGVLRVWAPGSERVEAVLDGGTREMERAGGGWWRLGVPGAGHGTRYRFSLDGGPPRADPRSGWQPEGIEGPSALVDHGRFEWHDRSWTGGHLASSVLYELHVGTFGEDGTFDGAIDHLDELVELGVDAIELLPVAEASGSRGWGYDGVLLFAPHHAYGGPEGLKRLVDACHLRGLAVVLDVVYNHLGPAGNYLSEYGPYFTDRYHTPWGAAVNFDGPGSDEVRRFVTDNARQWFYAYHLDGLRLDAVHAIHDSGALHVLEELAGVGTEVTDATGRRRWVIAESDLNDPRLVRSPEAGGYGLDAAWSDDFHHALHSVLTGERAGYYEDFGSIGQLAKALGEVYVFGRDWSALRGRHHGRPVGDLPRTRFLGYLQNHDQIGNRALGERSSALMSPGRLAVAAALVVLSPFVPMLFQGEEWGASTPWQYFTDHQDPALGRAVSDGRRREFAAFGWDPAAVPDPQDPATFARSKLDWSERTRSPHREVLAWHRELLGLRRAYQQLRSGDPSRVSVEWSEEGRWLVLWRGSIAVAANLAGERQALPVDGAEVLLLGSDPAGTGLEGGSVSLPADAVAVVGPAAGAAGRGVPRAGGPSC